MTVLDVPVLHWLVIFLPLYTGTSQRNHYNGNIDSGHSGKQGWQFLLHGGKKMQKKQSRKK